MIGCGSSCQAKPEHRPSADPGPPLDEADIAHLSPLAQDRVRAELAAYAVSIAHHEAGHAVAGVYFGRPVEYVQTGANPHCAYTPGTGERSERAHGLHPGRPSGFRLSRAPHPVPRLR